MAIPQSMLDRIAKQIAIKAAAREAKCRALYPHYVPGSLDPVSDEVGHGVLGTVECPVCSAHERRYTSDMKSFRACAACKDSLAQAERNFLRSPEGRQALAAAMAAK